MNKLLVVFFVLTGCFGISAQDYRTIDGSNNNIAHPSWGETDALLKRVAPADYIDGIEIPKLDETFGKPNPREVSNLLFDQPESIFNERALSDYTWSFGQFVDHDLTFILDDHTESLQNIVVPDDDQFFEMGRVIPMSRSLKAEGSGSSVDNPRNYNNKVTSYLDGSAIYGSTDVVAQWLRTGEDGKLKVSEGNLLPWNTADSEFNTGTIDHSAPEMDDPTRSLKKYFVAGDARANENPLLLSFHTLFVREHNRICDEIKKVNPFWSDQKIYEQARKRNVAYLQNITFNEWLPSMGVTLPEYSEYQDDLQVEIFNEFSAAAFRFGHTLINSNMIRMEESGDLIARGNISLKDAFFNPYALVLAGGVEPYLRGMGTQMQQEMDCKVIDDVRNFLFAHPGAPGLDLASININRGRERGLGDFNTVRSFFGLPKIPSFYELTKNQEEAILLEQVYGHIDNLDPWVGMLAETHMEGVLMGRLMHVIVKDQFQLLRDGDRFYFENDPFFDQDEIDAIKNTTLRDVLMRNTNIELMQEKVFTAMDHDQIPTNPELIPVEFEAKVNPTVVSDYMKLSLFSNGESDITIEVIDMNGRIVKTFEHQIIKGENQIYLEVSDEWPIGVYNLLVYNLKSYNIVKFVKV